MPAPGGAPWWALVTGTRLNEAEAVIFLVDITDRHMAVEELEEDDRRKNEFLAALAHELRNPLAPIAAGLEVLRLSGSVDGRATRAREVMERQVQHMIRLVEDLLEVSRITLGKIELRREPSDLAPILRTAIEACAPTFRAGQQKVTVDITAEPLPMYGDPVRLVQVFTNLLRNAAKYTPEDGSIAIDAAREGGQAVVTVTDTGMGIPPKMLPRIFDLFTQGPLLPDGQFQTGLGIGLTLVRTLVEAHGGQVAATSEGVGKGATFTVKLPLMPVQQAVPEPEAPVAVDLSAHRIVVVDDNHDAADSLGTLLSMLEAEVHVAYTGRDALAHDRRAPAVDRVRGPRHAGDGRVRGRARGEAPAPRRGDDAGGADGLGAAAGQASSRGRRLRSSRDQAGQHGAADGDPVVVGAGAHGSGGCRCPLIRATHGSRVCQPSRVRRIHAGRVFLTWRRR